jgi:hypothetical protein
VSPRYWPRICLDNECNKETTGNPIVSNVQTEALYSLSASYKAKT